VSTKTQVDTYSSSHGSPQLSTRFSPDAYAKGKKAILILASGGVFTEGPWKSWDTVEPYLRQILGFIGIDDVQTVRAQGMNIPGLSDNAIPNGEKTIEALAL